MAVQLCLSCEVGAIPYYATWTKAAKPRANQDLSRLHHRLDSHFGPLDCHEHYRVGHWTPHCSLATKVPQHAKSAAIAWANSRRIALAVEFDLADFVQFPPVVIHEELRLR